MSGVEELSDDVFEAKVLNNKSRPVVVDFYAVWCGPCNQVAPIFQEVASEYSGKVDFYKVNVDDNHHWASKFDVVSIPTFLFFKDGVLKNKVSGFMGKSALKNLVDQLIAS